MSILIERDSRRIFIRVPHYSKRFTERAKELGGAYNAATAQWRFPKESGFHLEEICHDVYREKLDLTTPITEWTWECSCGTAFAKNDAVTNRVLMEIIYSHICESCPDVKRAIVSDD